MAGEVEIGGEFVALHGGQVEPPTQQRTELTQGTPLSVAEIEDAKRILDGDHAAETIVFDVVVRPRRYAEFGDDVEETGFGGFEFDRHGAAGFAIERTRATECCVCTRDDDVQAGTGADHVDANAYRLTGSGRGGLQIHQVRIAM